MPRRRRPLLPLVLLLGAASPAAAQAPPTLPAEAVTILEREVAPGTLNGIIQPGDTVELIPRLRSNDGTLVTSVSGRLTSARADVVVSSASSPFPDLPANGSQVANTATPFRLRLPDSAAMRCGAKADFSLALRDGAGRPLTVSHTITTGAPGALVPFDETDDVAIPANGTLVESVLSIPQGAPGTTTADGQPATTSAVRVRIDRLEHPAVRDLDVWLVAPSGKVVELLPAVGNTPGADLVGTELRATGDPLGGGAPYTGVFAAPGLDELGGQTLAGEWKLRVQDTVDGGTAGTLEGWHLDLAPATCQAVVQAKITRQPNVGTPGTGNEVQLSAATSLPADGETIDTVEWDVGADGGTPEGTGTTFDLDSLPQTTSHMRLVRVTVTDSAGNSDSEELLIPFSNRPTARLVTNPVAAQPTGTPIVLDASASDDDDGDSIVEFRWDVDGDGTFERSSGAEPTLDVTFDRPGTTPVAVEVTDGYGATGDTALNVTALNRPPVAAVAFPAAWVPLGEPVTVSAAGSADPDGDVVQFLWDLDGDLECDDLTTTAPTTAVTPSSLSGVTVGVCAKDDRGAVSARATASAGVTRRPLAAITAAATVKPSKPLALSGALSTDPDGDAITAHAWDLDGNGSFETSGATVTGQWPFEGTRIVTLKVTDARGVTGTTTKEVTVANPPPAAGLALSPPVALRGSSVTLDARTSTDDEGIAAFHFDLDGDGSYETPSANGLASRVYANPQVLSVGVRVTDAGGKTATKRLTLTITAPAIQTPPVLPDDPRAGAGTLSTRPGSSAPGTGTGTSTGTATGTRPLTATLSGAATQRRAGVLARGLALSCGADRAVTCTLTATVARATAKRLGLHRSPRTDVVVGTATTRNGAVRLRLSRAAVRRLRGVRTVLVTVRGSARDARGASAPLRRAVTVRR